MTRRWAVTLPQPFNRRVDEGSLVFWRPGITVWTVVWGNDNAQSQQERLEWLRGDTSPEAFDGESVIDGDIARYSYRLTERRGEGLVHALYAFAIGVEGHVQMVIYCDEVSNLETARAIYRSLEETRAA